MTGEQGSLFETPNPQGQQPPERSIDEAAAHIAAHAPDNPYAAQEARAADIVAGRDGEDLAAEQIGHTPEAVSVSPVVDAPAAREQSTRRSRLELPGKDGRRNPGSQPLTPAQAQKGLTDAQIDERQEITARGAAAAREMLQRTQDR